MAGAGIWWSSVQAMLDVCARGWSGVVKEHHRWISFGGQTWRSFPRGPGADPKDFEVEAGQVRSMVRHLGISMRCAKTHLPALGPVKDTDN